MNEISLLEQVLFEIEEVKALLKVFSCLEIGVDCKSISLISFTYYEKLKEISSKLEKAILQE
ncbi:MAG: hypothetical protein JTJ21_09930 [Holdemanella sp.]|nr:hypothetical protein [Holdemanella sp.]